MDNYSAVKPKKSILLTRKLNQRSSYKMKKSNRVKQIYSSHKNQHQDYIFTCVYLCIFTCIYACLFIYLYKYMFKSINMYIYETFT